MSRSGDKRDRRRKRLRQRQRRGTDRVRAAGSVRAPNVAGDTLEATRHAIALLTAIHATPDDVPDLLDEVVDDLWRQTLLLNALLTRFIGGSCRELADAKSTSDAAELERVIDSLAIDTAADQDAWRRALGIVRGYAEVLAGARATDELAEEMHASLGRGIASVTMLIALLRLAHTAIAARCAETGEDVAAYLRRISLPAAEAHGADIDADAVDEYIHALLEQRMGDEPGLLARAAEALRRGEATLPETLVEEFDQLGGADRLEALAGGPWSDLDASDQRLAALTLIDRAYVGDGGTTVGDRVKVSWRF